MGDVPLADSHYPEEVKKLKDDLYNLLKPKQQEEVKKYNVEDKIDDLLKRQGKVTAVDISKIVNAFSQDRYVKRYLFNSAYDYMSHLVENSKVIQGWEQIDGVDSAVYEMRAK